MARTLDEAKRGAILTAAKTILMKDGYTSAKMSDIATEAKVAPGTLYLYFENKEALASAIGQEFFSRMVSQFCALMRKIDGPEGIVALVDWALQIANDDRDTLAMVKEHKKDSKDRSEGRKRFVGPLAEELNTLISNGVIRPYGDPEMLAEMILAMLRRLLMAHAIFLDPSVDQLRIMAIEVLQHALFDDVTLAAHKLVENQKHR
ncbi:MAG TPA: TetR/AcrR family transcriptional regulator [Oculatellaceae cyanobacterium]